MQVGNYLLNLNIMYSKLMAVRRKRSSSAAKYKLMATCLGIYFSNSRVPYKIIEDRDSVKRNIGFTPVVIHLNFSIRRILDVFFYMSKAVC